MLSNETVSKFYEMHMGTMAAAFSAQLADAQFHELSSEERFSMLVDTEWLSRKSNHLQRLIRNAGYSTPEPVLKISLTVQNASWIRCKFSGLPHVPTERSTQRHHSRRDRYRKNISCLCALGSAANRSFYTTKYIRLPELLVEITLARGDGTYRDLMRKYKKIKRLILDE